MQLVIKIPEEIYKASKNMMLITGRGCGKMLTSIIYGAIATGTPLPKDHGRLIDADELEAFIKDCANEWDEYALAYIEGAETIIEADTESEVVE